MTRGRLSLAAALVVVVGAIVVIRMARSEPPPPEPAATRPAELVLLVVNTDVGPFVNVVGSGGSLEPMVLLVPNAVAITIPGQGEGTVGDAASQSPRVGAVAVANLLGEWIPHHVSFGMGRIVEVIDRAGGIELGGTPMSGEEVLASILASGGARDAVWEATFEAMLEVVTWEPADVPQAGSPTEVADVLNAARGAAVDVLPTEEIMGGVLRADLDVIRGIATGAWGRPDREVEPVIVLNGSGVPAVGELVAEHLIPGGFRVVVSENASSFDHDTTMVVVPDEEHRALGERVRDLLGVGEVQVAGPASGLADVTIVVGKDFTA